MGSKRVLVAYGIDVDAAANHLNTTTGPPPNLTNVSRGVFGATRGVERLLELFARQSIPASWFIPGHSIESFPTEMARIRDSPIGHEIGLHNYMHEFSSELSAEQFEKVLTKSIEVANTFLSQGSGHQKQVVGYTAPSWVNSPESITLLEKHGLLYDHSFMHDDFQPYYAPYHNASTSDTAPHEKIFKEQIVTTNYKNDPSTWMLPMLRSSKASSIVEIPASWTLDDWPPFQWNGKGTHGYVDPHSVERQWREQFDWCYREYDSFIFPMTIHPQVSGRPHILLMHERLIDHINSHAGVKWCTFAEIAKEFREGKWKEERAEGRWLT